jgi:hypothetical protein
VNHEPVLVTSNAPTCEADTGLSTLPDKPGPIIAAYVSWLELERIMIAGGYGMGSLSRGAVEAVVALLKAKCVAWPWGRRQKPRTIGVPVTQ